jgi:hypothetical protein
MTRFLVVIGSIGSFSFIFFTILLILWTWARVINFNSTRCDGSNQHKWSYCVDSSMWVANRLVLMCYAHGYGKSNNFPTLWYITLCHYTWKWLLALDLEVWTKRLCLFTTNNTDYFGCDYRTCYSTCVEGFTFWNVVVGRLRWLDMEGPCAQLCTMSSS